MEDHDTQNVAESVYSAILKEDRPIEVFLPDNYKADSKEKYDVIYVLDGEMLARYFPPIRSFEQENELIPPVIIVSIKNNYWYNINQDSRERDLLPVHVDDSPLSGGADNFISFLKNELIPFINKKYPTTGKSTLFGHSYGGLFTLYAFFTHPEVFDSYIASDPALWWNDGFVGRLIEEKIKSLPDLPKTLFIGGRSGRVNEAFGIQALTTLLREKAPSTLKWQSTAYPNEHHGSVRFKSIYDSLKFTYFGYNSFMLDFFPVNGILIKGKPAPIMVYSTYLDYNPGIRYTTDGAEPLASSPKYEYGIHVSAPAELTLKQFSNWGPNKTAKGQFRVGKALSPVPGPPQAKPGGLHYAYYEGSWERLPDFNTIRPAKSGQADKDFNINQFADKTPFACLMSGWFESDKEGYYIFFLEADDIARFYIGDQLLMDIDMARDQKGSTSFIVPLKKGLYPVRMEYLHRTGDRNLRITYLPPSPGTEHLAHLPVSIPLKFLYSSE